MPKHNKTKQNPSNTRENRGFFCVCGLTTTGNRACPGVGIYSDIPLKKT